MRFTYVAQCGHVLGTAACTQAHGLVDAGTDQQVMSHHDVGTGPHGDPEAAPLTNEADMHPLGATEAALLQLSWSCLREKSAT